MSGKGVRVRRFEASDADGIIKLLKLAYRQPFSMEWWDWKYRSNPTGFFGNEGDIWIAESANGEIVGHWAVIPERIKFGSETVIAAQGADAATHPEYRRLGINKVLSEKVFSDIRNRYSFVFGFPSEVHLKILLKRGWKCLPLQEFVNFLDYDRALTSFSRNASLIWFGKTALKTSRLTKKLFSRTPARRNTIGNFEVREIDRFPSEIDDFWKNAGMQYEMCIERTSNFLNWRFSRHFKDYRLFLARSSVDRRIIGYMVLLKKTIMGVRNVLDIIDLQALQDEDECVLDLIALAEAFASRENLDSIHCSIPTWHRSAKLLSGKGYTLASRMLGLLGKSQPHMTFHFFSDEKIHPDFRKWFYTFADTDYA